MVSRRRDFVDENRDILVAYRDKMNDDYNPIRGFGCTSPRLTFDAVLNEKNYFFLPLCFCFIFWDLEDSHDREFVLKSLAGLYKTADDGDIVDPVMAYVYAYCLCQSDKDDDSYNIVEKLANQCFPPAIATMGDGLVANKNVEYATQHYRHARFHKYEIINGRYFHLELKDAPFYKQILIRVRWILVLFKLPLIIFRGLKGEHALYLDFYKISYHLDEYWKIPKPERIKMRKQILAEETA